MRQQLPCHLPGKSCALTGLQADYINNFSLFTDENSNQTKKELILNINSKSLIAGLPALKARDIARKLTSAFSPRDYARQFSIDIHLATQQIEAFSAEGYFERIANKKYKQYWGMTVKGCALVQASAAKKVKRATADRHYQAFMDRVKEINQSDEYLYQVTKVTLFGSYLTDSETVSDIDLFVWLARKPKLEADFNEILELRTALTQAEGRYFKTYLEQGCWPELDVRKYLKNGSRVISIQGHNLGSEQVDYKVVFELPHNFIDIKLLQRQ